MIDWKPTTIVVIALFAGVLLSKSTDINNSANNSSKVIIGTNFDKPAKLNLNTSSDRELKSGLIDIDEETIKKIVKNRPYKLKTDLLDILDETTYKRVAYKLELEG